MRIKLALTVVAAFVFSLSTVGPASAAQPPNSAEGACVDQALDRALDSWSCLGGDLTYEKKVDGKTVAVREVVAETAVVTTQVESKELLNQTQLAPLAAPNGTDDWWCEDDGKPVCTSKSEYLSKTKGNVAYGNRSGVVGTYDIVILSNLNGRSSRGTVQLYRDSGPSLNFSDLRIVCDHAGNAFGCGSKYADNGDGKVSVSNKSWIGPEIQGNKLTQNGKYNDRVTGKVTPAGAPTLIVPTLPGAQFNCTSGSTKCKFP